MLKIKIKKKVVLSLILFIFLILFFFYIINQFLKAKNDTKEHYLTFFLPYNQNNKNELLNFYINNDNTKPYFTKKFNYDPINFGVTYEDVYFTNKFINYFLSKSKYMNLSNIIYKNYLEGFEDLLHNKISFQYITPQILYYYTEVLKKDISNIRFVTSLYKEYLYIITLKKYNVFSLDQIPSNFNIGILATPSPFSLYFEKFFNDLNYKLNKDYNIIFYNNFTELTNGFNNNECNMIIIEDIFPSNLLYDYLDTKIGSDVIILPFETKNKDLFFKKNSIYTLDSVDLNLISPHYLPRKFGKYYYFQFKPDLPIISTYKCVVANTMTSSNVVYSFLDFIHKNYKYINEYIGNSYKINDISIETNIIDIRYHKGSIKFFQDYGYTTNVNNDNCKYLYGRIPCTEENLKKNNLFYTF
jgi:hypothetical protein